MTAMPDMLREAEDAGVRLLPGHVISEATGQAGVESVTVGRVGGRDESSAEVLAVDCVVLATGRAPEFRVASLLGAKTAYEHDLGGWVPVVDELFRTSDRRVLMAGDASGIENGAVATGLGRLAGLTAAEALGMRHPDAAALAAEATGMIADCRVGRRGEARAAARRRIALDQGDPNNRGDTGGRRDLANASYEVPEGGTDSVVVCRCTGAIAGDVRAAVAPGNGTASEVRRLSGAGMGVCQGRYCEALVARLIAEQTGRPLGDAGRPRGRAPVYPVTLFALAMLDDSGQDAILE
jgi:NAD(P)H-nitrite reductase large subunit